LSLENVRNEVALHLINKEQNTELLKTVPHRDFLDMAVVYYWYPDLPSDMKSGHILVTNKLMESCALTEEELYNLAYRNTLAILPLRVVDIMDKLGEIDFSFYNSNEPSMLVLTNDTNNFGAASMMYPEVLDMVAEIFQEDFYIIPSSVHELLAIRQSHTSPQEMESIISCINANELALEERLSNQLYAYDIKTKQLSIATDASKDIEHYDDYEDKDDL